VCFGDVETSRIEAGMLLGGASFDWQLALKWLVPMTNSQMEGVSGSLVPMFLVDEVLLV